jgi:DNA polymerase-3 subunit epsilon
MRWKDRPIVAFDTETTGLSPFNGDRVIEFAAAVFHLDADGRIASQESHSFLINPGMPIPRTASEVSKITDKDVADQPPFEVFADRVAALLGDAITVAHNFEFDMGMLSAEFQRMGRDWPEPFAEVDTVHVSLRQFPDAKGHKLHELCDRLGVDLTNAHRALNDAAACGRCFIEMARRAGVSDDLQAMLDWANAIGRPPDGGPLGLNAANQVVFVDDELRRRALAIRPPDVDEANWVRVTHHPILMAWMDKARVRRDGVWMWRYPDSSRKWVRRWLSVRGAGRSRTVPKGFNAADWVLDSSIAVPAARAVGEMSLGRAEA